MYSKHDLTSLHSLFCRPTIFDPSELRTDVTGKVVRYLQDNGADVKEGEPFVEVEAMKMIMPIKATESGKITQNLSPGSVINAGDLLGSLELKDPSKVKKILPFDGDFDLEFTPHTFSSREALFNILAGYDYDTEATVAAAFQDTDDIESATDLAIEVVDEFVRVESMFDSQLKDDVVRQMTKDNSESLDTVISLNLAHQKLSKRASLLLSMVRQIESFSDRFGQGTTPERLYEALGKLSDLEDKKSYGEVAIAAENLIRESKVPGFNVRLDDLRKQLLDEDVDLDKLSKSATLSAGVDLLTCLFKDEDSSVRAKATEAYIRRVYRAHRILDIEVKEVDGKTQCKWSFRFADVPESESVVRYGLLSLADASTISDDLPSILSSFGSDLPKVEFDGPANVVHIVSDDGGNVEDVEKALIAQQKELNMLGVRTVNLLIPVDKKDPKYYSFPQCDGYKEAPLRRNMRPTFHHLLELSRLDDNFDLKRLPSVQRNAQVYVGTERTNKPVRGAPPQVVFVRGVSHAPGLVSVSGARRALVQGLDELERTQSNSDVTGQSSSRIFLHSMPEIEGTTATEVAENFATIMETLKSKLAKRLLKLRVDEVEVKVRLVSTDEDGNPIIQPVRLVASSMEGEWLKTTAFMERPDPVTGVTKEFCVLGDGKDQVCFLDPYAGANIIQTKRAIARRVGSTYAYDFLGLLEVGLIGEWDEYVTKLDNADINMPSGFFSSQELIEGEDGKLAPGSRPIGTNKVGMVSWVTTMKTPEYPEGRDVVFIANDVTVQSGSFGVEEDEHYLKASQYARERGLPRIYIACNAGARIGLVDELKPKIQVKFVDEAAPSKGFEYLYLTEEDYNELPEGSVNAHKVAEGYALDDIIGTNHGIGVENLRGSGMIAGETSQAYDEIFTLSYVTGRSVGIGAYLVRLGQRIIQMKQGPMILTGFSALNKLLGRSVYNSQDQLGGPQIMSPNGVSHEIVDDDQQGVASIIQWLSFVPKNVGALPASRDCADPVDRDVVFRPTPTPYDPRLMLSGTPDEAGFFDEGSFKEYLAGWGKSVIVGRGRLGGIPMGAIAVETRLVEQVIPADPADVNSREAILPQAGKSIWTA
jgi:acetyl-CoA carboxylase/biotin carboxylase 1